jgi:hypothetical protein
MSEGFASYGFLSWLRRGIAAGLSVPDGPSLGLARISLPTTVYVSGASVGDTSVVVNGLFLYGPGEVTGFDTRAIARVWPLPNASDAEPNYFPFVELVPADLPWQYTSAAPEPSYSRLRPWFCLIALKDDEYTLGSQANGAPFLTVKPGTPLPKLSQAWAWAHVQVAGGKSLSGSADADVATISNMLANQPGNLVARVLCPRRLDMGVHYTAFVVPVFARGVQAGLGTPPDETVDGLAQSWADQDAPFRTNPLQLPAYYSWSFSTNQFGDFGYLVRQLRPNTLPNTVGVRLMDVGVPGGGLPGAAPQAGNVLGVEGALKAPDSGTAWSQTDQRNWINALAARLQAASPLQTALPLYGRWHAARTALDTTLDLSQPLPWFDDLNTDPRLRVAAALGVAVVQAEQQQLMASAWRQGAGIAEVNAELRHAQLGREVTNRLYKRHLLPLAPQTALQVTSPLHARVSYTATDCVTNAPASRTVKAWLAASLAPRGFFDPQWRRVSRVWGGPHMRRGGSTGDVAAINLYDSLMAGTIVPSPVPPTPAGMASMAAAGIDAARLGTVLAKSPKGPSTSAPANYYPSADTKRTPPIPPATSDNLGTSWTAFAKAAKDLQAALAFSPPAAVPTCPLAGAALSAAVLAALDPNQTMAAAYAGRLKLAQTGVWRGTDPLGPVYIAPNFPQPAFEPLRKLSQEWIIPGLARVPLNTIAALAPNQRFIEAYMAGLNFELGRELLWNGFPTDQRGSYFRQFWDHGTALTPAGQLPDPQSLYDIDVITHWMTNPLGKNPNPQGLPAGLLFLLIRGDLLHRFPNALLYATCAIIDSDKKRAFPDPDATPPPQEKYPLFSGSLAPDVSFFAFDLPYAEAFGDPNDPNDPSNPGWYFVLQEHAAETRFGLEAAISSSFDAHVTDWWHMNWGSFAADETALSKIDYIDLDASLPDTSLALNPGDAATAGLAWHAAQGSRASDMAYVTLRDPLRVAIHASSLLPSPGGG